MIESCMYLGDHRTRESLVIINKSHVRINVARQCARPEVSLRGLNQTLDFAYNLFQKVTRMFGNVTVLIYSIHHLEKICYW